jgi:hypothetical protein
MGWVVGYPVLRHYDFRLARPLNMLVSRITGNLKIHLCDKRVNQDLEVF